MSEIAIEAPLGAEANEEAAPAPAPPERALPERASPAPSPAPLPAPAPATARSKPRVSRPSRGHDVSAFLFALVLQSATSTLEALGWRHPLRLPVVLLVWAATTAFLGLPTVVLTDPTLEDILLYGNWRSAAWLSATIEVGAVFIFQVLRSGSLVSRARRAAPGIGVAGLLQRGEALYWTAVGSPEALKDWMERVKAWTQACERELTETLSAEAADAFRRPSVMQVHKHRQALNEVHNGWLDLLSKRLDALRRLSHELRPKRRFVEEPGPGA